MYSAAPYAPRAIGTKNMLLREIEVKTASNRTIFNEII